jgi:hypothetical protein
VPVPDEETNYHDLQAEEEQDWGKEKKKNTCEGVIKSTASKHKFSRL